MPLDERPAHCKTLRQANHGVINGDIAVRVVFADNVTDHAGAFLVAGSRIEFQLLHGE